MRCQAVLPHRPLELRGKREGPWLSSLFGEVLSHGQVTGLFFKIICAQAAWERELGVRRLLGMRLGMHRCVPPVEVSAGCPFLLSCHMSALNDGLGPAGV